MIKVGNKSYEGNSKIGRRPVRYEMTSEAQRLVVTIKQALIGRDVVGGRLSAAATELQDWICLPASAGSGTSLGEAYYKEFPDNRTLLMALIGHQFASEQRVDEERLAFSVPQNWEKYEAILDPLLDRLVDKVLQNGTKGKIYNWSSYYGPGATLAKLPWKEAVKNIDGEEKLDRLYKKIAFIHDFARAKISYQTAAEKTNITRSDRPIAPCGWVSPRSRKRITSS